MILIIYDLYLVIVCSYDSNKYQFTIRDLEADFFGEDAGLELFEWAF